jgi:hypothetical protein
MMVTRNKYPTKTGRRWSVIMVIRNKNLKKGNREREREREREAAAAAATGGDDGNCRCILRVKCC